MNLEFYFKNRKYFFIFIFFLFFSFVLSVYIFLTRKNNNTKKDVNYNFVEKNNGDLALNLDTKINNNAYKKKNNEKKIIDKINLNKNEIAKNIVLWLKEMENKVALQCSNKKCESLGTDRQREIGSIWAFFNYYLYSKDESYFNLFKDKLKKYAQLSREQQFQSDFLQCYYINDIYQKGIKEKLINENLKKYLDDICINNIYFRERDIVNKEDNINNFNSEFLINRIKSISSIDISKSDNSSNRSLLVENKQHYLLFITAAADHVARYFVLNKPINLYAAKAYFDSAVDYFIINKENILSESPFLGLAAISIYKVNLKDDYLNFAKFIFDYLDSKNKLDKNTLFKIGMAYLGKEIYLLTKETKYLDSYNYYFDNLLENNFDIRGYKGFRENKKIFHNGGDYIYIYDTRINYLTLNLILSN